MLRNSFIQRSIQLGAINQNSFPFSNFFQLGIDVVVRLYGYALLLKKGSGFFRNFFRIDKKGSLIDFYYCISYYHRIKIHIAPSNVEQPSNFIQSRKHKNICLIFFHLFAQGGQFMACRFTRITNIVNIKRLRRQSRSVFPNFTNQIDSNQ